MKTKILQIIRTFRNYLFSSDKWLHLTAGFIISFYVGLFSILYGFVAGIIAAAGKEIYDKMSGKGTPEIWDFVFTVIGVLYGILNVCIAKMVLDKIAGLFLAII